MSITGLLLGESRRKKRDFFIPYLTKKDVIDIGCIGKGENLHESTEWLHGHIARASSYCVGIDHDERKAKELNSHGYNILAIKAQHIHMDRKFDAVCAFDVLEHIEDPKSFFSNARILLHDEGKLLISVPNPFCFLKTLRAIFKGEGNNDPDHVCWYCNSTIKEMLKRNGFKVERLAFASGETRLYYLFFLPRIIRHTSMYVVAGKSQA
jgi:SAM-dependent methyltransferase